MDIEKIFQKLHTIQPDSEYTERSRAQILGEREKRWTLPVIAPRRIFARTFEAGAAIVLAGVLVFLILGGFSIWQRPAGIAGIDPAALRAEAHAVDTQIQLVDLDYAGLIDVIYENRGEAIDILPVDEPEPDDEPVTSTLTSTLVTIDDLLRVLAE